MKFDEISFLFGLLYIPIFFLFFKDYLLKIKVYKYVFLSTIFLLVIGITKINEETYGKPNFYLFLFCPLFQFLLLHILLYFFRKYKNRNPINPPRKWFTEDNLDSDRFFYFIFMILSLCTPMFLLAYFYT